KTAALAFILGIVAPWNTGIATAVAQTTDHPINLLLSTLPPGQDPQRYEGYVEPKYKDVVQHSLYVTMRDGVKIAIDVNLPKDLPAGEKIPTVMRMTRYWRSSQGSKPNPQMVLFFAWHGYATVVVDVRGTGASF